MREPAYDPYPRLLARWQARRTLVDSYHRALRFLTPDSGSDPERQRAVRAELNAKLAAALLDLREASEALQRAEQNRDAIRLLEAALSDPTGGM